MIGQTLGHYQVLSRLGEGGMGVVYKARDTHLDRFVALKVLPPEKVADPDRKRRFVQEAKAHSAGIVHRDLKPTNIMVSADGVVKVLDFGLAKLTEPDLGDEAVTATVHAEGKPLTERGVIVGTVAYMSPEQAEGKPVDARSDIFSLGSVLYELVTGQQPFQGPTKLSTLSAILKEEPKPPSSVTPAIPTELERLISRCLRKDPAKRFQHMDDVKIALEELKEESDSGKLAPSGQVARLGSRWGWATALAVTVAVLAVAGWFWLTRSRAVFPEAPMMAVPLTSFPGREVSPSFSPDGNQIAFSWNGPDQKNYDIYVQMIGSGGPAPRTTDPAADTYPAWSPDSRRIAFKRALGSSRYAVILVPPVSGPEQKLTEVQGGGAAGAGTLAWHPTSPYLAAVDGGAVVLLSTETGEKRRLTTPPPGRADANPAFSPDGRMLAFSRGAGWNADIYLLSVNAAIEPQGEPRKLTADMGYSVSPAWTADGHEIVFEAGSVGAPNLWRVSVAGPGKPQRLASVGEGGSEPALSHDGRRLVYSRQAEVQSIYRTEPADRGITERPSVRLIASSRRDLFPKLSPDGNKIAFQPDRSGSDEIWVCDANGSNAVPMTSFGGPITGTPRWSPDGQQIVFDSRPDGIGGIFTVGVNGGKPLRLTTSSAQDMMPSWSWDGKWIYFDSTRSGSRQVWKVRAPGASAPEEPIRVTQNGGAGPQEAPDGKFVFYRREREGSLWRVPIEGGEETQVLDSVSSSSFCFEVTTNGIYFIPRGEVVVRFFDFQSKVARTVAELDRPFGDLAVSRDGRTILYSRIETRGSDILMVEKFR